MKTLLIRVAAPLQSWGSSSKYNTRGTESIPTKSGIIGMLAAALGRHRGDDMADIAALKFGVRVDNPGIIMRDYQTTVDHIHPNDKKNNTISNRMYISDATFLVAVEGESDELINSVCRALDSPRFTMFLGRKSCPLSYPYNLGIRNCSLLDALKNEPWVISDYMKEKTFNEERVVRLPIYSELSGQDGTLYKVIKDNPVSFSLKRAQYNTRRVFYNGSVEMTNSTPSNEIDFFAELAGDDVCI